MSILQEAFYIIEITYVAVSLLIMLSATAAILIVRRKVRQYVKLVGGGKNGLSAIKIGAIVFKRAKKAFSTL